jgi:hypothetical protein
MTEYKGENGVTFVDNGDVWRAIGSRNVIMDKAQTINYMDRNGRENGIKYSIGPDPVANGTRIAYIDYPKNTNSLEELAADEDVPKLLMRCNVCSAMDQTARLRSQEIQPVQQQFSPAQQYNDRVSLGDAAAPLARSVGASLPKLIPFILTAGKSMAMTPLGDLLSSVTLSVAADIASGLVPDPKYKAALQQLSDNSIDSIGGGNPDAAFFAAVREDVVRIADAQKKDNEDMLLSIGKGMFKSKDALAKESAVASQSSSIVGTAQQSAPRRVGSDRPLRLWGE